MKRKLLLSLLGILIGLPIWAETFEYVYQGRPVNYTVLSELDKTCMTAEGQGSEPGSSVRGALVLPEHPMKDGEEYTLTEIGDHSFYGCTGLTSVEIPASVTNIAMYAFSGCTGLTSVEIPASVTNIAMYAFSKCTGLTSVEIPASVTNIEMYAFSECTGLTSVEIPASVTNIEMYAFSECSGLTSVRLSNGLKTIGDSAFEKCNYLEKVSVDLDTDTERDVRFPESLTSIGSKAFDHCFRLRGNLFLPNSLTEVSDHAFSYCDFNQIWLPPSIKKIGSYAFSKNLNLVLVVMGYNVISIGEEAFSSAGTGCYDLVQVYITNTEVPEAPKSAFPDYSRKVGGATLYVLPEMKSKFADSTGGWSKFKTIKTLDRPYEIQIDTPEINMTPGESVTLSYSIIPDDILMSWEFLTSSDENVVVVDEYKKVATFVGKPGDECKVTISTNYPDGPTAEWIIKGIENTSELTEITIDNDQDGFGMADRPNSNAIFTADGVCVKRDATQADIDALPAGLYIVAGKKVVVK